ncbi:hypothetical protein SUDANB108_05824 [Streptomyces sp. enrichment culture]
MILVACTTDSSPAAWQRLAPAPRTGTHECGIAQSGLFLPQDGIGSDE